MIITCGNVVLCSGIGRGDLYKAGVLEAPGLIPGGGGRATQKVEYVRSAFADEFDRGNAREVYTFWVRRIHNSLAAAQNFRQLHRGAVEGASGTWLFQPEAPGEGATETVQLAGALLREVLVDAQKSGGVMTLTKYVISGYLPTTGRPPPA